MTNKSAKMNISIILAIGTIWGAMECFAGLNLKGSCARLYTGSFMTGLTFMFFSSAYILTGRLSLIMLLPVIAGLFRIYAGFLTGQAIMSGAIANPVFAFFMEAVAFIIIIFLIKEKFLKKTHGQAITGIAGSVMAVNLFLPVKFVTGIPACSVPGTSYPLAIWGLPVAMTVAAICTPAGFKIGNIIKNRIENKTTAYSLLYNASGYAMFLLLSIIITVSLCK